MTQCFDVILFHWLNIISKRYTAISSKPILLDLKLKKFERRWNQVCGLSWPHKKLVFTAPTGCLCLTDKRTPGFRFKELLVINYYNTTQHCSKWWTCMYSKIKLLLRKYYYCFDSKQNKYLCKHLLQIAIAVSILHLLIPVIYEAIPMFWNRHHFADIVPICGRREWLYLYLKMENPRIYHLAKT